jgi:predicted ATP-grasp superfamily ATP-dependent carboligase
MHLLCREFDFPTPRASIPTSREQARDFAARVGFPLVVKRIQPWHASQRGPSRSTTLLRNSHDLSSLLPYWPEETSMIEPALMLQEYLPGGRDSDWFFHGYCDSTSSCRPGFTGVKERSYPAHAGLTSLGRGVANKRLRTKVEVLLRDLSYRGLVDLDLRRDAIDGQFRLLDFNPRVGAQFRVFEDGAGLDVVRAAYLDLTGQPVPAVRPRAGRRLVVENYDLLAALGYARRGELSLRAWVSSLRAIDETAWFARDDLAPFGLMCLRTALRVVRRTSATGLCAQSGTSPRYRPGRGKTKINALRTDIAITHRQA